MRKGFWAVLVPGVVVLSLSSCAANSGDTEQSSAANETATTCGNGVRDTGEQCDDGNTADLDGCSSTCAYESFQRMNSMSILFATDSYCTSNALGGAVGSQAQSQLQSGIGDAVTNGTVNLLFKLDGQTDATAQNAPALSLSSFLGTAASGVSPGLDAWYTVNPEAGSLAATGTSLSGTITNGALTAGPGNLSFALALSASGASELHLSNTKAKATIGAASVPAASSGSSPGEVAGEHLDPALKALGSIGSGQICGNISAASLAAIPAPDQITSGSTSCSQGYTSANSLLDIFVGGCTIFIVTAFNATQPDKTNDTVAAVGAGGPYKLSAGSNHKVSTCKDKSGATVDLSACLATASYSAGFKFTTQRVVSKGVTAH